MGGISDHDIPELSLRLGSGSSGSDNNDNNCVKTSREKRWSRENKDGYRQSSLPQQQQQQQQQQAETKITIFYDGQICVCDVTEIQARAIISMARKEMEEKENRNSSKSNCNQIQQYQQQSQLQQRKILAPNLQNSQLSNSGLSMKRSLQRTGDKHH
ncbi:Protein TIFY 5A [Ananas comosus]|uniref:Protein TIFY n=1 Tax=Ananas comosus TaxID=4615 RepID=A0A199VCR0_ANACO|nr:Protein TIFY 5A [Ananas comosus]